MLDRYQKLHDPFDVLKEENIQRGEKGKQDDRNKEKAEQGGGKDDLRFWMWLCLLEIWVNACQLFCSSLGEIHFCHLGIEMLK